VSSGGACQPAEAQVASASTVEPALEAAAQQDAPSAKPASSGATQGGGQSSAAGATAAKPKSQAVASAGGPSPSARTRGAPATSEPIASNSNYGASQQPVPPALRSTGSWLEGFGEKETLGGLSLEVAENSGVAATVSRKRQTAGFMAGIDRTVQLGSEKALVVGAMGGHANTFDRFTEINGTVAFLTPYTVTPLDPTDPRAPTVTYDIGVPHDVSLAVQQEQQSETVGLYGSLVNGNFYVDGLFSVDFRRLRQTTLRRDGYNHSLTGVNIGRDNVDDANGTNFGCITNQTGLADLRDNFTDYSVDVVNKVQKARFENYVAALNFGYRAELNRDHGTWWEPSGTVTYTHAAFGSDGRAMGLDDGDTLRLQGGARVGITQLAKDKSFLWTVSAGAYAYSDVLVDGYVIDDTAVSAGSVEAEEGLARFLGTLRADVQWLNGVSWYVEGDTRQGEDLEAYGGKIGGRVAW
jgi:hypothetical protein